MSNYEKIVKLACKPKNAPPKAKYVDVLVSATYSDDGSLNDITRSLALRLREPNAVIVFKALLTLHQMIRSGSTDQLLEHLSQGDQLRLRNVSGQNWEGYSPPSNMGAYAQYLDSRIKVFRDLNHDLVRVQTESNRRSDGLGAGSKARRLRHLAVEKGLLREVKGVQRILDALVQCRFYDDDLRDENTVLAFRMLIKDLLILFQAGNEGVCNILEHYFEMSKIDATESFEIYKSFIKQTDRVVDYLGVVRKLHNVLNVPVPNLKHAPTSLVKALEEYLHDPNFEQNRIDYKKSLGVVEGKPAGTARTPSPAKPAASESKLPAAVSGPSAPAQSGIPPSAPSGSSQKIQDFLDSIQSDHQPTMFGGAPTFQQTPMQMQMQQPAFNPFRQSMMLPQQTGFMAPQMTGFPMQQQGFPGMQQPGQGNGMEFLQPQQTGAMAFGNRTSMFQPQAQDQTQPFLQFQSTAFLQPQPQQPAAGFLQPQTTGSNPFRQSTMINTHTTGTQAHSGAFSQPSSPFNHPSSSFSNQIQRPGSTPATSFTGSGVGGREIKPLVAQQTGSKNPFAPAGGVPPVPKIEEKKVPTMAELAAGRLQTQQTGFGGFGAGFPTNVNGSSSPWGSVNGKSASTAMAGGNFDGGSGMSEIASAFTMDGTKSSGSGSNDFLSQFGSLSISPPGATSTSGFGSINGTVPSSGASLSTPTSPTGPVSGSGGFLQPQRTGYGGSTVRPFKPSSTFGSQLMDSLPPIPEPSPSDGVGSPAGGPGGFGGSGGVQPQQTGFPAFNANAGGAGGASGLGSLNGFGGVGSVSSIGTGTMSSLNLGGNTNGNVGLNQFGQLAPQATGTPNPFRQSTMFGAGTGMGAGSIGATGTGVGTGAFGAGPTFAAHNQPQTQSGGMFGQGGQMGQQRQGQGQQGSLI